ncbi:fatty acid desaturase family protein [Pelagibius sp. Alg239-R121]|uniref:fatty acid desaturase family protein n=1 Tax=Pelagibius sp. Alg239-R121 TaxID=2993448 RepID=UPI0024A6ED19|nr:fatty acid desaturase family protein [Pelagibius sp. Alg239-R121]
MKQLDHKGLIAGLNDAQREDLLARSDAAGLRQAALHLGAIFGTGALILLEVPFQPLLMLVQGILIVFLFTALHETIHKTAFATPAFNKFIALLSGFLLVLPPDWFRYFHFAHHRHTNDPARDPELAKPKPESLGSYLWYLSGLPVWVSHLRTLVTNAAGRNNDSFVPPKGAVKVRSEARFFLALYAGIAGLSILFRSDAVIWVWLLPIVIGQPVLRAYLLAEHARCPQIANMLENSRTTFTNAVVRFLAWNMPYHAEHHAFPAVPFHKLADFHTLTRPHLKVTEQGYGRFHLKLLRILKRREDQTVT